MNVVQSSIKVSVIIPCYNDGLFIAETIESVKQQSYNNWQCIIVNDGSADNTGEVVQRVTAADERFIYIETENNGPAAARNAGIEKASGFLILPLDADDIISANYIEKCVEIFAEDENVKLVYGFEQHDLKSIKPPKPYIWETFLFTNMIHCCGMFKKEDWKNMGGYDINMRYGLEDWEFWISLIHKTGKVIRVDAVTLYVRTKPVSRTTRMQSLQQAEMKQYIYKKHTKFYNDFFEDPVTLYTECNSYKRAFKAIEKKPFYFALSRIFKKKNL